MRNLNQERGFHSDHVVMAQVRLVGAEYTEARRIAFHDAVLAKLHELPGASDAAVVSSILDQGQTWLDGLRAEDGTNQKPSMT